MYAVVVPIELYEETVGEFNPNTPNTAVGSHGQYFPTLTAAADALTSR